MELGGIRNLEQHVFHDVAAELLRVGQCLALEEHVLKPPGLCSQRRRIAHLARQRDERMSHRATGCIASRPALARTGIRRMAIGAQRPAIDPRIRHRIDDLLACASEHDRRNGRRCDPHQQHMIQTDSIEAVLEGRDALNLVRLDHGREHVAHGERRLPPKCVQPRQVIRNRKDGTQVVRRVTPLCRKPGVVEIEPADHRADVERRLHGIELV